MKQKSYFKIHSQYQSSALILSLVASTVLIALTVLLFSTKRSSVSVPHITALPISSEERSSSKMSSDEQYEDLMQAFNSEINALKVHQTESDVILKRLEEELRLVKEDLRREQESSERGQAQ